jgi:CTP:molybdopterin cytidylyltransferase MocA
VFDALRSAPIDTGAKSVVRAHEGDLLNVPVDDEGCLIDVDTPQEYQQLRER